ncbi:TPA: zinc ribbon domain-containing protein [Streptococcus suis]
MDYLDEGDVKMEKFCQSCTMPLNLNDEDVRGTEVDGSKSAIYCYYCYGNGAFLEPNIEFEQMLEKGKKAISNGKGNAVVKFLMKASYPMMLKKAQRWKK